MNPALEKSYRLLAYRPRSEYELICRLKQASFDEELIDQAIAHLRTLGLLNDELFAANLLKQRLAAKAVGNEYLRSELRHKGIDWGIVEALLADLTPENEMARALESAAKKVKNKGAKLTKRQLAAYLRQKGFSAEIVIKTCQRMAGDGKLDIS